jgi:CHC2-type zinc finger protein
MNINAAKTALPFPALLNRIGVPAPDKDKFKMQCPLHDEEHGESLSVQKKNGTWLWKCFGKCNRGGDEITFLQTYKGVSRDDAIKLYLELAGNGATKKARPRSKPTAEAAPAQFDWDKCGDDCGEKNIKGIADWRGFAPEFVREMRDKGHIGIYRGRVALPVHSEGKIIGAHVRLKNGDWYYEPKGIKTAPLVFGELVPGEGVQVFESTWDGLDYMDKSGERDGVIITRGASNGARVCSLIPSSSTAYLWTQNDEAGENWQKDICANTGAYVRRVRIPEPHKDLNDWTRAGATSDDLFAAILNPEILQEPLSPEKLFNDIKHYLARYIVFSRPEHADVITLWIMHTWVADQADFTPYIYLHSPVMRCGKTQVQRVVEPLVRNPLRTCNVSEAALYREIEESHPTLLWDEIDAVFGSWKS